MSDTQQFRARWDGRLVTLWISWLALVAWTRFEDAWLLALAAVAAAVTAWGAARLKRLGFVSILLLAAVVTGFWSHAVDRRFVDGWGDYWAAQQTEVAQRLQVQFDALVDRGDSAVSEVARVAVLDLDAEQLQDSLDAILDDIGMAAVAVVGIDGRLSSWAGRHHGRIPADALDGLSPYSFAESPLFSYLYFTAEIPGGYGTALVAALMRSGLPASFATGLNDFASTFRAETRESIRITRADRARGGSVYDFGWPDETLLSITVLEPSRTVRRAEDRAQWTRAMLLLLLGAWLLLSAAARARPLALSLGSLVIAAMLVPLQPILGARDLIDPAAFLLSGPFPVTLGRLLVVCLALVPVLTLAAWRRDLRRSYLVAGAVVAVVFPLVVPWMGSASSLEVLGTTDSRWTLFLGILTLVLALFVAPVLAVHSRTQGAGVPGLVVLGLGIAAAMGLAVAGTIRTTPSVSPWLASLWAIPAIIVALGFGGRWTRMSYVHWFAAVWLACTAALPFAWSMRTEARMAIAGEQLGKLGLTADPYLEFLLDRFAARVDSLNRSGASDVELLYQGWTSSGLVDEGSPIFLTLWSPEDVPEQELRLGVNGTRPEVVDELLGEFRQSAAPERRRLRRVDAHYVVSVPLRDGRLVTGAIPPRRSIPTPSALGPLFANVEGGDQEFLTIIPALAGDPVSASSEVVWTRNDEGWRGERSVQDPERYTVFYTISIPRAGVMFARGTLLLTLILASLSVVWLVGVE